MVTKVTFEYCLASWLPGGVRAFSPHPNHVRADGITLVSDAMAAAGMPDGDYVLGTLPVIVDGGVARYQQVEVLGRGEDFTSVGGVNPGTRIIVEGAGFLGDGDRVTVAPSE